MARLERVGMLPVLAGRDAISDRRRARRSAGLRDATALRAAIDWLCLTHDVTGRRGCSKGFSLTHGWSPAYPETTGYIIGTLLEYGRRTGDDALMDRAHSMGEWELEMQAPDGGIPQGVVREPPLPSIVFDTGMVIHGWLDLTEMFGETEFLNAAIRAGTFLVEKQSDDGAWRGRHSFRGIPHTYHSRVAWALLRLGAVTGDSRFTNAGLGNLAWVRSMQAPNGWFDACAFVPGRLPNTHGLAYTLRGLIEGYALTRHEALLTAAITTSDALIRARERLGTLPAVFDQSWEPAVRYVCLTGVAQLGGVWLRIHHLTGESRFSAAGTVAVEYAAGHQEQIRWTPVHGALAGSFPIYGRYAPLQYPNWAAKFLADALMTHMDALEHRTFPES